MSRIPTGPLLKAARKYLPEQIPALKERVYVRMAPADALKAGDFRVLLTAVPAAVESPLQRTWNAVLTAVVTSENDTLAEEQADAIFGALEDSGEQDRGRKQLPRDDDFAFKTVTPIAVIDPRPPREKGKRLFEYGLQFGVQMEAR